MLILWHKIESQTNLLRTEWIFVLYFDCVMDFVCVMFCFIFVSFYLIQNAFYQFTFHYNNPYKALGEMEMNYRNGEKNIYKMNRIELKIKFFLLLLFASYASVQFLSIIVG